MLPHLLGAALFVIGWTLKMWSIYHLRKASVDVERIYSPQYLTKKGPYYYARHPLYIGYCLVLSGLGMIALGWGGCVLCLPALPFFRMRVIAENDLIGNRRNEGGRRG